MIRTTFLLLMLLCTMAMTPQEHFVKAPFRNIMAHDTQCMTEVIYREAPDESYEGKMAVATVVVNRLHSKGFPKTICAVIYQKGQFSWTTMKLHKPDLKLYAEARRIALYVLSGHKQTTIGNALYFHNLSVNPSWDHVRLIQQIGNHAFYVAVR
jgi:N-acetylmuramoyl-L-alanine amidase